MANFHYFVVVVVQSLRNIQLCSNLMDCSKPGSSVLHCLPVCSNSCLFNCWCYLTISSCVPFSCPLSFPVSVFSNEMALCIRWPKYWSFSITPMNIQGWFPLEGLLWWLRRWSLLAVWETQVQSLGQENSPEEGNGNPLQYPCLKNSMDEGA